MRLQVFFKECQLVRGKILRPAVVQNGEVGLLVVEAVVWRMLCVFLKQAFGAFRPDVVIAGRQIEGKALERRQNLLPLTPLGFRGFVVQALNGVTGAEYEGRSFGGRLPPDALINSGLGLTGPIAEDNEAE